MTNGLNSHYGAHSNNGTNGHSKVDTMNPYEHVHFDPSLKPKEYQIKGTDPNSKVLFRDVNIIDSSGGEPFKGDVYIEGKRRLTQGTIESQSEQVNESNTSARSPTSNSSPKTLKSERSKVKAGH